MSVILSVTTATLYLLKPLKMPFTATMIGGVLVIGIINSFHDKFELFPYVIQYVLKTISFIGNSELGRLAYSVSLCLDVFGMVTSFVLFDIIPIFGDNGKGAARIMQVAMFYVVLFRLVRPCILKVIDRCENPDKVNVKYLVYLVVIVVLVAGMAEYFGQMFAIFLFALSLPEDPLSSILIKWLDGITFGVFFPLFCAMQGQQIDLTHLEPTWGYRVALTMIFGSVGKFFGTYLSSMFVGLTLKNALAIAIIMSSKGLFDIVTLSFWASASMINIQEYSISTFHFLVCTGALLPLVRFLYKPSSEYSNILGTSVMDISENGTLKAMACIHKEENIPGLIRLIEAFDPSRSRPIPLISLQLIQLTGRVSMPVRGLLDQVKSTGVLGQKLVRCENIVESLSLLDRAHKGNVRLQHYVSVAPYDTMHNDICNLAYERNTNLLIIPFHVGNKNYSDGGSIALIRSLNKMILENAPCAVGILIDRTNDHVAVSMTRDYRIAIIYIGGMDDREALAYMNLFATNRNISIMIIWLKSPYKSNENSNEFDYELIDEIRTKIKSNERLSFDEVIVQDGAETTDYLVSIKDRVDLVVAGRSHNPNCGPLYGLTDGWSIEYPELGILGDLLATSDFQFSVLIVHSSVGS
ncbi:cation/H(+) antiporter 14-like [Silene latifolia]|uniref:cation/H(+) antiporter 14-like n=1 Tax=Silene latifolia TaxID=37657 RepID=UPI003D7791DA